MSSPAVDELVGQTIAGKYRVDGLVGRGAMGSVYRAKQLALNKTVAVKVINPDRLSAKTFTARFKREAKAASIIDHPNLVRVIDFGEEQDGLLYLVMEFLEGKDLFRILQHEFPLSRERVVTILSQTLAALAAAHEVGVIHRDLKPENIMLTTVKDDEGNPVEQVKVLDFGIAKIVEREDDAAGATLDNTKSLTATNTGTLTRHGMLIGTPEYMSPEQARGEPADARSDLYSIGIILYQLLVGRLPFQAASKIRLVIKHVEEEPIPPSSIDTGVDLRLEAVCMRALQKRPDARFQTAREMRSAVRAVLSPDGQMPPSSRSIPIPKRRPSDGPPTVQTPPLTTSASTADPGITARALLEARRLLSEDPPRIQQRVSSAPPPAPESSLPLMVFPPPPKVPSTAVSGRRRGESRSGTVWSIAVVIALAATGYVLFRMRS